MQFTVGGITLWTCNTIKLNKRSDFLLFSKHPDNPKNMAGFTDFQMWVRPGLMMELMRFGELHDS